MVLYINACSYALILNLCVLFFPFKATFLKLAGPQLVQMFIGDGAKLVRDAFALAKEKAPSIIFIDELDAIGTKRYSSVCLHTCLLLLSSCFAAGINV